RLLLTPNALPPAAFPGTADMLRRTLPGLLALLTALPFVQTQGADAPRAPEAPPQEPTATPADKIKVHKDFRVELLYTVPKDNKGSWAPRAAAPKGRLIVSAQYGGLSRVPPPKVGGNLTETKVEKIPVNIGDAQGLLWAFDSLYVMVNSNRIQSGLYRVRS